MTIKVIRRGTSPAEKLYETTCNHCTSILEFKKEDVRTLDGMRNEDTSYIMVCPVCIQDIYVYQLKEASPRYLSGER